MIRIAGLLIAAALFTACGSTDPAGPVVNNSGDNNCFNISRGANDDCSTPAPVVIQPVITSPEPVAEPA